MGRHKQSIGIDFGTSTSFVAERFGERAAEIVPLGRTTAFMPSIGGFDNRKLILGEDAESLPTSKVIRSVKSAITRDKDTVAIGDAEVPADDLIQALLTEIARRAKKSGANLARSEVRLGCPAMWTGPQRARLSGLAQAAGLPADDSSMIDEPIAAGVSWLNHRYLSFGESRRGRLLVFDMGGGTLDVAALDVVGGPRPEVSVLSALGADRAGDSLDELLVEDALKSYDERGINLLTTDEPAVARAMLTMAMRRTKVLLSHARDAVVRLDAPFAQIPPLPYSRMQLQDAFRTQMDHAMGYVWGALRQAKLTELAKSDPVALRALTPEMLAPSVNFVLLAGGMSQIPYVHERLSEAFPGVEIFDDCGVTPAEAIVAGLTDNTSYERLNLHRPGFNFVLQWAMPDGEVDSEPLYAAHTPFYEMADAYTRADLSYRICVPARRLPSRGEGLLRAKAMSGDWLQFRIDGVACPGISVPFGNGDVVLVMSTNGKFLLRDGRGEVRTARVSGWPVIRGHDHNPIALMTLVDSVECTPDPWHWDKEFAGRPLRAEVRTANW